MQNVYGRSFKVKGRARRNFAVGLHLGNSELSISTLRGQFSRQPGVVWKIQRGLHYRRHGGHGGIAPPLWRLWRLPKKMRPYHAGLLGVDSLFMLDEAHLVPPFEALLASIEDGTGVLSREAQLSRRVLPPFRVCSLSATGRARNGERFALNRDDVKGDAVAEQRVAAPKGLILKNYKKANNELAKALAIEAWDLANDGEATVRVAVFCNERKTAQEVATDLNRRTRKGQSRVVMLTGARRARERQLVANELVRLGFLGGSSIMEGPTFLVASAGEVGVDLDADHMVGDVVAWDRMVQRLGRVNRRGNGNVQIVLLSEESHSKKTSDEERDDKAQIPNQEKEGDDGESKETDKAEKDGKGQPRLQQKEAVIRLISYLPENEDGSADVSPRALKKLVIAATRTSKNS